MPDPFTAAVAAAVTGSSAAQAEYYQAYQQYYQQYYASQYAAQFYSTTSGAETSTTSGITSVSGDRGTTTSSSIHESVVQQNAVLDEVASQLYARVLQQAHARGSQEYAPGK